MIDIIRAEFQKSKRTSINKFIVISPLLAIFISFLWGGGQNGAYNWWYTMFLPGILTIISSQVISIEKNLLYKGILLYPRDKGAIWLGKIIYISILLILTSLIFMAGIIGLGLISESSISLKANIYATIILIITSLFITPVSMFLTVKFNMFISIIFNMLMIAIGVVFYDTNSIIKFLPYRIWSTLMIPILGILPNGLPAPENDSFLDGSMIMKETITCFMIFIILALITALWFRKEGEA